MRQRVNERASDFPADNMHFRSLQCACRQLKPTQKAMARHSNVIPICAPPIPATWRHFAERRTSIRTQSISAKQDFRYDQYAVCLLRVERNGGLPMTPLFPGSDSAQPMTTRQLNRACHAAAQMPETKNARL